MCEHRGKVDAPRCYEVEVVSDCVLSHAVDLFDSEGVGPDDRYLLEVQGRPLPASRVADAGLDQGASSCKYPRTDLECLGTRDSVVDEVDLARVCKWQPSEWRLRAIRGSTSQA